MRIGKVFSPRLKTIGAEQRMTRADLRKAGRYVFFLTAEAEIKFK
jgi:hypothetical protein